MKFNIFYIRFQDFDSRSYLSSEIELCREFYNRNYVIKLIGIGENNKEKFYHLFRKRKNFINKILIMFFLFKQKDKKSIFIFDSFSVYSSILLLIYRRIFGAKYRIIMDSRTIPVETHSKRKINHYRHAILFAYKFFDGFTFITKGVKNVSEKYINKKIIDYYIIPSGTNTKIFKKYLKNRIEIDEVKDIFTLFYHGTLTKNRGVIETIKAIEELNNEGTNVKIIIIGDGDKEIIDLINNSKDIIYLGKKKYEEIPMYINEADIAIVPLPDILWWNVSSPLKLIEYMACEKPVILTNIEAHKNVIENCKAVCYIKETSVEEIKKAILYTMKNIEELNKNSYKLRKIIIENFSYNVLAKNVIKYYKSKL